MVSQKCIAQKGKIGCPQEGAGEETVPSTELEHVSLAGNRGKALRGLDGVRLPILDQRPHRLLRGAGQDSVRRDRQASWVSVFIWRQSHRTHHKVDRIKDDTDVVLQIRGKVRGRSQKQACVPFE